MKQLFKTLLITLPLLAIAVGVSAYSNPGTFPTDTDVVPVTIGVANQVKLGGLGVTEFIARDNAAFNGTMFVSGLVRGGDLCTASSCPDSTVTFGDSTTTVELGISDIVDAANPSATRGTLTTEALSTARAGGSGLRKTCSNGGQIVLCQ